MSNEFQLIAPVAVENPHGYGRLVAVAARASDEWNARSILGSRIAAIVLG